MFLGILSALAMVCLLALLVWRAYKIGERKEPPATEAGAEVVDSCLEATAAAHGGGDNGGDGGDVD
ncbi:MAG: hypothetical protein ACO1OQ_15170 [Rufibacter sp.]